MLEALIRHAILWSCVVVTSAFMLALFAPDTIHALGVAGFNAYPTTYDSDVPASRSWFIYNLKNGQVHQDRVTVASTANIPVTLKVYAVDATTTDNGSFALLSEEAPRRDIGAWVTISQNMVTLTPHTSKDIPFQITIPTHASIGDHIGGIAFQQVTPTTVHQTGATINVISRVGIRIYETIPGNRQEELVIAHFSRMIDPNRHDEFNLTLTNKGNVELDPVGTLTINDFMGHSIELIQLNNMGVIAPDRDATYHITTQYSKLWPSYYDAQLNIRYGSNRQLTDHLDYFVYRWYDFVLLGVVALLVAVIPLFRRFSRRRSYGYKTQRLRHP